MSAGPCSEKFCSSSFKDNCRDECRAAKLRHVPRQGPGYNVDKRNHIYPYYITKSYNFIRGGNYDQVTIGEIGDSLSYVDAMNKAVSIAKQRNAYGFFYQ